MCVAVSAVNPGRNGNASSRRRRPTTRACADNVALPPVQPAVRKSERAARMGRSIPRTARRGYRGGNARRRERALACGRLCSRQGIPAVEEAVVNLAAGMRDGHAVPVSRLHADSRAWRQCSRHRQARPIEPASPWRIGLRECRAEAACSARPGRHARQHWHIAWTSSVITKLSVAMRKGTIGAYSKKMPARPRTIGHAGLTHRHG